MAGTCPKCGAELRGTGKVCHSCATIFSKEAGSAVSQGPDVKDESVTCTQCGRQIGERHPLTREGKPYCANCIEIVGGGEKSTPPNTEAKDALLRDVLRKYLGQRIGMNLHEPKKLDYATLLKVGEDHLSVLDEDSGLIYHFPLSWVINVIEASGGIATTGASLFGFSISSKKEYRVIIEVFHLVVYSGAAGVLFSP